MKLDMWTIMMTDLSKIIGECARLAAIDLGDKLKDMSLFWKDNKR